MSDDWHNVHQLAVLAGLRLIVLANRVGCEHEFLLKLHDGLAEGLAEGFADGVADGGGGATGIAVGMSPGGKRPDRPGGRLPLFWRIIS